MNASGWQDRTTVRLSALSGAELVVALKLAQAAHEGKAKAG